MINDAAQTSQELCGLLLYNIKMQTQIYYLIRSRTDGRYLTARLQDEENKAIDLYLLLFKEDFAALSYINTHAQEIKDKFTVESIAQIHLKSLLKRWNFQGFGLVTDPLEPRIDFLRDS